MKRPPPHSSPLQGEEDRAAIPCSPCKGEGWGGGQLRLRAVIALAVFAIFSALVVAPAFAASGKQPAPAGSLQGAPPQYTRFTAAELQRGFMALAFGSDLRIGARPKGIRRFDHPIRLHVATGGSIDRAAVMLRVAGEYAKKVADLKLTLATDAAAADIEVRLIDEKEFSAALTAAFGRATARAFVAKTNPQCMTSVKSQSSGEIVRAVSFIIVDKGDDVFLDCAYHELLHAFGLSNHDQRNAWTTLNQKRMVGYLTVYDRSLLTLLYDPRMRPGMTPGGARTLLPQLIQELGLVSE
jgi:hypothetical protein